MKKVDFKKLEIKGIDGKPLSLGEVNLCEQIGNAFYNHSTDVNVAEIGKRIYKGEIVELRAEDVAKMKEVINDEQKFPFISLIKRTVVEFIDNTK